MYEKVRAVVLRLIRYSERNNIVHAYTDGSGLMSFLVPAGTGGAGARRRQALLMPLSLLELEARLKPGTELATMHDMERYEPLQAIYSDPPRVAIAMFVSELLCRTIVEHERNEALFAFIEASVLTLEHLRSDAVANFHLLFLYRLGAHLGIEPNMETYATGRWFDMMEGVFTDGPTGRHALEPERAAVIRLLDRMTTANLHLFRFNHKQRGEVLDTILAYYRLHNAALGTLRSLDVLKQIFQG